MATTRAQLHRVPAARLSSPSLELEKYHHYDTFQAEKLETKKRDEWFGRVLPAVRDACTRYPAWHSEFDESASMTGAEILMTCTSDWRLVIGWASNPGLETGITLHRLFGFPYLPGSAVRGVVHHLAELDLLEGENPMMPFRADLLAAPPSAGLTAGLERALFVRAMFGSLHLRRPAGSDLLETPIELLETWRDELLSCVEVPTGWAQAFTDVQILCGAENLGGVVSFLDAVPEPKSLLAENPIQVDVLTSHYSKYYTDLDNHTPTRVPADTEGPNPVKFLAVRPGLKFEFRVRFRIPEDPDDEAARQISRGLGGRSVDDIRGRLQTWLLRALTELGIGAKTTAGYGFFARPLGMRVGGNEAPVDYGVLAVEFLPPELPMGTLAQRIDEARRMEDPKRQTAIALQLSRNYRREIATWRKSDKQAAKERVAWLDKLVPTDGGGEK